MKKLILALIVLIAVTVCAMGWLLYNYVPRSAVEQATGIKKLDKEEYSVYQTGSFIRSFSNFDEAVEFANGFSHSYITRTGSEKWLWDNYPQFAVDFGGEEYLFGTFWEALSYARGKESAKITNRANRAVIWQMGDRLPTSHMIEGVPLLAQYPELPRGCEVTSLAMLLNYYGIGVSKMDLAEQIKKDPAPFVQDKNGISFGNPAKGFVGDMYNMDNPGLGVYNGPIFELLKDYIGNDALNLTGCSFSDLFYFLARNKPVLVITTSVFKQIPNEDFVLWNTEEGPIYVTNYEHSVLLKGYDGEYVYFNNPLDASGVQRAKTGDFIQAWEQMGKQAVTYFE